MKLARVFKQSCFLCSTFSTTTTTFSEKPVKSLWEIPGPKCGKMYKDEMMSGYPMMVCICDATNVETVFRSDGKYPQREEIPIIHEI